MGVLAPNIVNTLGRPVPLRLVRGVDDVVTFERGMGAFEVYVPVRHGRLEVNLLLPHRGTRFTVIAPDGTVHAPAREEDDTIWVYVTPKNWGGGRFRIVVIAPSGSFSLYATFSERGSADVVPWNFWYFPFKRDFKPDSSVFNIDLWDPLNKYEYAFGVEGALQWEYDNHSDITRPDVQGWEGHCQLGCIASLLFEEPKAVTYNGVDFTAEEVKFLATEVAGRLAKFDSEREWKLPKPLNTGAEIGLKPDGASGRFATELFGLIAFLRDNVRIGRRPLITDLRDAKGGDPVAKWNHAVYAYRIEFVQPLVFDLQSVRCRLVLMANRDDHNPDGSSTGLPTGNPTTRAVEFVAKVETGDFRVDATTTVVERVQVQADDPSAATTYFPRHAVGLVGTEDLLVPTKYENPKIKFEHVSKLVRLREAWR